MAAPRNTGDETGGSGTAATLDVIAGLSPEEEQQPEKRIEVAMTPELERILRGFEQVLTSHENLSFDEMLARLTPKQMPAAIITEASVALGVYSTHEHFKYRAGVFLTALVNNSPDEEHTLFTRGYSQPPVSIANKLRKKLTVHGTTGRYAGDYNQGELILAGNTGPWLGFGNAGKIILTGDAGKFAGQLNKGHITINGNAGDDFGDVNMGTIFLNGTYRSFASQLGKGDIYRNGVLIVDKGRRLI